MLDAFRSGVRYIDREMPPIQPKNVTLGLHAETDFPIYVCDISLIGVFTCGSGNPGATANSLTIRRPWVPAFAGTSGTLLQPDRTVPGPESATSLAVARGTRRFLQCEHLRIRRLGTK